MDENKFLSERLHLTNASVFSFLFDGTSAENKIYQVND